MTHTFHTSRPGSEGDRGRPHVILVGLPGSGKTTVGRSVADRLDRPFLDLDLEIERREGESIGQIFGEPKILAVLDWELSTLGNPLADFTYFLMGWVNGAMAAIIDKKAHGAPTIEEVVAEYCRLTGRDGLPDLNWYFNTAATSEENREKVLEAVAKASKHVRAALELGNEDGKVVWWWPMVVLLARRTSAGC